MKLFKRLKKVLVVEDDPALRKALVANIAHEGYTVLETGDGSEVITMVLQNKPDLMVLDLMLPGKDGMTILAMVREGSVKKDMPVIILSNLAGRGALSEQARTHDAIYFDKASTDVAEIVETVRKLI